MSSRSTGRRAGWLIAATAALILASLSAAPSASAAFRDIRVHITNNSDAALVVANWTLDGGCWGVKPPERIEIDQTVDIASESCGVFTGTEFHVSYWLEGSEKKLQLHYSNPAAGSDTFEENAPEGYAVQKFGVVEDRTVRFGCDSACDGIPLAWKQNGVTIDPGNGNPPQFVDLPKMSLALDRPNILVQLDWMQDATHDQRLRQAALDTVINAFDQTPVTYRGATRPGITLRIDAGPDSTITPGGTTWGSLSRANQLSWSNYLLTGNRVDGFQKANFYTLVKDRFVPTGRLPIFHYAVAADVISQDMRPTPAVDDNTSGLADPLGFMVTLGNWDAGRNGTLNEQTGTFMHELGHVIGLDHSGGEGNGDGVNYKPNYPSVMNYAYTSRGVFRGGTQVFDFSRDTMPAVDETQLTEAGGANLGANPSGYGTTNSCAVKDAAGKVTGVNTFLQATLAPVDWDCDSKTPTSGTGFDGNGDDAEKTLGGSTSDWSRIMFRTGGVGAGSNAKDVVDVPSSGVSAPNPEITLEQDQQIRVLPLESTLTYTGVTTADYHDVATMKATLVDPEAGNASIPGRTISFRIGAAGSADTCSATTDATGSATCPITVSQAPGNYPIRAAYAGDALYGASSDTNDTFTVTREETTLTLTSPSVILAGSSSAAFTAQLVEGGANETDGDGSSAPPVPFGQTITFTLGGQSCSDQTNAAGVAACSLPGVSDDSLGNKTLTAAFAGDVYYEPSSDSDDVIVFAFPSRGAFVLGDTTVAGAAAGDPVTWWGDDWWLRNAVSGGAAPDSFKGFAQHVTTLPTTTPADSCGAFFRTLPGNSPPPTSEVPEYMGVVVASSVAKSGSRIDGVWGQIVVVRNDPGYRPNAGHPGTGEIVATFCP